MVSLYSTMILLRDTIDFAGSNLEHPGEDNGPGQCLHAVRAALSPCHAIHSGRCDDCRSKWVEKTWTSPKSRDPILHQHSKVKCVVFQCLWPFYLRLFHMFCSLFSQGFVGENCHHFADLAVCLDLGMQRQCNGGSVWICKPKWSIGLYYGNDDKWDDLGYPSLNYMKLATGIGRCEA